MLKLHSNFTADGTKPLPGSNYAADGLYPTNHAEQETVEITQGINSWSEVGLCWGSLSIPWTANNSVSSFRR